MTLNFNYNNLEFKYFDSCSAKIAFRKIGNGPPLLLVHGWPVFGYTWRYLIPKLSGRNTCYIFDMPGLGDSKWNIETNFNWRIQAQRLQEFINYFNLKNYSIVANNSGGAISRLIAIEQKGRKKNLKNLILINTEIPFHRPPWIPFYQKSSTLPFSSFVFRNLLKSNLFLKSSMGFKAFYFDKSLLSNPNYIKPYVDPLIISKERLQGAMNFLRGCDMKISDTFRELHREIHANVLLIWGQHDPIFPIEYAQNMAKQFQKYSLKVIQNACFMPHEEKPLAVTNEILTFLEQE